MSSEVSARLTEIGRRGEERRRRTGEVRRQSDRALERLHARVAGWDDAARRHLRAMEARLIEIDAHVNSVADGSERGEAHVLDEVRVLLEDVDTRERELWNDDDARILLCFRLAIDSAARKGYTLSDLLMVLRSLAGPDSRLR